jgi:hypothetical protein
MCMTTFRQRPPCPKISEAQFHRCGYWRNGRSGRSSVRAVRLLCKGLRGPTKKQNKAALAEISWQERALWLKEHPGKTARATGLHQPRSGNGAKSAGARASWLLNERPGSATIPASNSPTTSASRAIANTPTLRAGSATTLASGPWAGKPSLASAGPLGIASPRGALHLDQ